MNQIKQKFAIVYRRGPSWVERRSIFEQPLQAHLAYMKNLSAQSILLLGGPFTDDTGGLIVVAVDSLEEANALINKDPAVQEQIMCAEAHPWKLIRGEALLNPTLLPA
jgi:uncharacterized protein YciI